MNKRFAVLTITAALVLASLSLTMSAFAQDTMPAHARYTRLAAKPSTDATQPAVSLPTWPGTFVYQGKTNHFVMVGTDPSTSNATTTIPVFIVPVRLGYKGSNGSKTIFDPSTKVLSNGKTVIQNVLASPIFNNLDFTQGGTDLGNTQYIDAYQRGNFWTNVMTNTNYHVLLGTPTVLPTRTLVVPTADGSVGNEFGVTVGLADINWFDTQINAVIKHYTQITPASLVIFVTYDSYLTEGGCCIGGYHSATGSQTYAHFTYLDVPGVFSQDVSALSHEIGEWMDDPLINNVQGACGGLLENGDPLEGEANYGGYPYTLNGFTFNLQDLVFLKYFGQTPSTSVNNWVTFQGTNLSVCQNGQ
jgi:hypothetical protein